MNDGDWIDYTGFLSTGDCSNFAFGTIETYFGGTIQEIILLQSIYVLTMLEVVEEIPIRYQVPSTTTCNQDLEIYRRLLYFFHGTMVSANTCTTNF